VDIHGAECPADMSRNVGYECLLASHWNAVGRPHSGKYLMVLRKYKVHPVGRGQYMDLSKETGIPMGCMFRSCGSSGAPTHISYWETHFVAQFVLHIRNRGGEEI